MFLLFRYAHQVAGSSYSFFLGGTSSGKYVTERSAMQMTAVYGSKFFANGAAPSGVLGHPGTIKDELNAGTGNITVWINSPGGDCVAAAQIYNMLAEVKESIMNAYEIKTSMSRRKNSHLIDAETWMDAHKAVELGFADDVLQRADQDAYESLLSLMYIPVCLDNIVMRGDYQVFDASYDDVFCPKNQSRDFGWYKKLDNGTRINKLNSSEKYQGLIDFPANRLLRNGIGHNNTKYDSITQTITAYDLKRPDKVNYQDSLMTVAVDCLGMAKSTVVFSEMILFMLRREFKNEGIHSIIHPRFYKDAQPNDKYPF